MIIAKNVEYKSMTCTSCNSKIDLLEIKIGFDESQTTTIRLCKKCREKLMFKIKIKEWVE